MIELLVRSDGQAAPILVVRKYVDDAARLNHQVRWLSRAQGSGVVRLHAVDPGARHYSTSFAGPLTLAAAATRPEVTLPILGEVWRMLERLHRLGLAHGSVAADHVVLGSRGPLLLSPGGPAPVDRHDDITHFGQMITGMADVWSAADTVGASIAERWATTGRRIATLGAHQGSVEHHRLVSGAEVRGHLAELQPVGRATRWFAPSRFRKLRPGGSGRGHRADPRPSRS